MANFTGAAQGAIQGAVAGGVPGAVIGGIGGLFGRGKKRKKQSTFDEQQQKLNESQYAGVYGEGPLSDLYNYNPDAANSVFNQNIARPAYRGFQENIIPQITGQFRSQGLQNSSYAGEALSNAGRDVQESLDAQRSKYLYGQEQASQGARRQAIENLQNRSTFAYEKPSGGFDINSILQSIPQEAWTQVKDYFNTKPQGTSGSPLQGGIR